MEIEGQKDDPTSRVLDLITPIGKGQRALIVAPPQTGKTVMLQKKYCPLHRRQSSWCYLIVLLIDERPESDGYGPVGQRRSGELDV